MRVAVKILRFNERYSESANADCKRAADLIESLSSPPETVEELRERIVELTGDSTDSAKEMHGGGLLVVTDAVTLNFREGHQSDQLRAAWFAIVGMMGVGRG